MPAQSPSAPISAYLHIPFCETRCAYCDFNTYADLQDAIPAYVEALATEIRGVGRALRQAGTDAPNGDAQTGVIHSIFFGGGTPSLLGVVQVETILSAIRDGFDLTADPEITLEANPGTVSLKDLEGIRQAGVNRLSLGVQSGRPSELRLLERKHSFPDVVRAVSEARRAGFSNLNLDLIFGLPYQEMQAWQTSLTRTLDLGPDHVSLYALSLEFGTPMHAWVARGLLPEPDGDLAAEMYAWAGELLEAAGFIHYEVSNWARTGTRLGDGPAYAACRHNLQYWRNRPYLGFGAGAHGWAGGRRYANVRSPRAFIRRMAQGSGFDFPVSPAVVEERRLTLSNEMNETMMLGLRMLEEGVEEEAFLHRFGIEVDEAFPLVIMQLQQDGLIERRDGRIRLTKRAHFIANQVFCMFV